jgi:hypothetical protein
MSNMKSDNLYTGGITYSTPAFIFGNTGSINGGYSFDLPLATVAAFNSQGLDFLAENTKNARGFFTTIQESASNAMSRTEDNSFALANNGLGTLQQIAYASIESQERIHQVMQTESTRRVELMPEPDSGWCFITTAVCESEGLPDDCDELQTLRKFRDEYMRSKPDLSGLVDEYYKIAPEIVVALKQLPNGGAYSFDYLKRTFIVPAVTAIKSGHNEQALEIYCGMVNAAIEISKGA